MGPPARYDGFADWYEAYAREGGAAFHRDAVEMLGDLLGAGSGRCLDIGCGGGALVGSVTELGWSVVGVDVSADQLRVARANGVEAELVEADATELPFEDGSFDAAIAVLSHTDVDGYGAALREAARVLRPGGVFVHVGLHPCFAGHFARPHDEGWLLRPGYHETGLSYDGVAEGVRVRVGAWHLPLSELLNAVLEAGLATERFAEAAGDPPLVFGLRSRRAE